MGEISIYKLKKNHRFNRCQIWHETGVPLSTMLFIFYANDLTERINALNIGLDIEGENIVFYYMLMIHFFLQKTKIPSNSYGLRQC